MFLILFLVIAIAGLAISLRLSPWTERLMALIWEDPTRRAKTKVAKRVKELCVDGDVPGETAALIVAKEESLMEEQVKEVMRTTSGNPELLRMAAGGRIGRAVYWLLKKLGPLGGAQ